MWRCRLTMFNEPSVRITNLIFFSNRYFQPVDNHNHFVKQQPRPVLCPFASRSFPESVFPRCEPPCPTTPGHNSPAQFPRSQTICGRSAQAFPAAWMSGPNQERQIIIRPAKNFAASSMPTHAGRDRPFEFACRSIQSFSSRSICPIIFGRNSSSSHPARARRAPRARARQGPLNFTCASVTVRILSVTQPRIVESAVAELAPKRWGTCPSYATASTTCPRSRRPPHRQPDLSHVRAARLSPYAPDPQSPESQNETASRCRPSCIFATRTHLLPRCLAKGTWSRTPLQRGSGHMPDTWLLHPARTSQTTDIRAGAPA